MTTVHRIERIRQEHPELAEQEKTGDVAGATRGILGFLTRKEQEDIWEAFQLFVRGPGERQSPKQLTPRVRQEQMESAPVTSLGLRLYHTTTREAVVSILAGGFRDHAGYYLTRNRHSGVWLSDRIVDAADMGGWFGPEHDTFLEALLRATEEELRQWEWVEDGKGYREWLIPAAFLNARGDVRVIDDTKRGEINWLSKDGKPADGA